MLDNANCAQLAHWTPTPPPPSQTNNHTQVSFKSQTKKATNNLKKNKKTQQINNQCKLGKVSIPNMNTGHPVSHCPWLHPSDSCSVHSSLYPSFSWASGNAIIHVKIVSYRKLRVFSLISTQAPSSYYYLELRFNRTVSLPTLLKNHCRMLLNMITIIMTRCECWVFLDASIS